MTTAPRRRGRPRRPPPAGDADEGSSVGVLDKVMLVLEAVVAAGGDGVRVTELAPRVGLPVGTVHRLVVALVHWRLLRQDAQSKTYGLGPRLSELAEAALADVDLRTVARPGVVRLADLTGETAIAVVFEGDRLVCIAKEDGRGPLRTSMAIGDRLPLHATAAGKAALAFAEPERQMALLARLRPQRFTDRTLVDLGRLDAELQGVRIDGFAIEDEEHAPGIRSIAAPIVDLRSNAVGAIAVTGASVALTPARMHGFASELVDAAQQISVRLGADPPDLDCAAPAADEVRCALPFTAHMGASPVWCARREKLFWLDMLGPAVHCFDPASGDNRTWRMEDLVTGLALFGPGLLLATRSSFQTLDLDTGALEVLARSPHHSPSHRHNKGACDARGRFWSSNMGLEAVSAVGNLLRLDEHGRVERMDSGLTLPNAIGWSPDQRTMYLTDSAVRIIYAYDFDLDAGTVANRRPLVRVPANLGRPTGLAVDVDGFLWSVHADGARLTRYAPDGGVERVLGLPVPRANGCGFGGPDMRTLFIATSRDRLSFRRLADAPLSGSLFAYEAPVAGLPSHGYAGLADGRGKRAETLPEPGDGQQI
jgi:DNA-binding IclR family transcriptional regulator/sugar lactone lactonase YvrE